MARCSASSRGGSATPPSSIAVRLKRSPAAVSAGSRLLRRPRIKPRTAASGTRSVKLSHGTSCGKAPGQD
eukprot:scaffold15100_cov61-Phaeocystis_antarctica.AAC.7